MTLVKFLNDVYPYCKGDVVKIEGDEKARVDEVIKDRGFDGYKALTVKAEAKGDVTAKAEDEAKAKAEAERVATEKAAAEAVGQAEAEAFAKQKAEEAEAKEKAEAVIKK